MHTGRADLSVGYCKVWAMGVASWLGCGDLSVAVRRYPWGSPACRGSDYEDVTAGQPCCYRVDTSPILTLAVRANPGRRRSTQAVLLDLVEQRGLGHPQFLAGLTEVTAAALQGFAEQVFLEGFHRLRKPQALGDDRRVRLLEGRQAQRATLRDVAQFAHVTWPVVVHQRRPGLRIQLRRLAVKTQRRQLQEVLEQLQDVFATFAQRRQLQGHHVQAVVQVAAKLDGFAQRR